MEVDVADFHLACFQLLKRDMAIGGEEMLRDS